MQRVRHDRKGGLQLIEFGLLLVRIDLAGRTFSRLECGISIGQLRSALSDGNNRSHDVAGLKRPGNPGGS